MVKKNTRVLLHTDGSGYQGIIDTAMVIPQFRREATECIGIEDTLTAQRRHVASGSRSACYNDSRLQKNSQPALRAMQNPRMASGQMYIRDRINLHWECMDNGIDMVIYWKVCSEGIHGFQAADCAAKQAAMMGAH